MTFLNDVNIESGLVSVCCRHGQGSACKSPCPNGLLVLEFLLDDHSKQANIRTSCINENLVKDVSLGVC